MKEVLDLLIIGAGPAGLTAAIYASRTWMNFKIIDKMGVGGQVVKADMIENYPGVGKISGIDLALKYADHLNDLGVKVEYEEAAKIEEREENGEKIFSVITKSNKEYLTKKIIIATGVVPRKLGIDKEEFFTGKGISYCTTCDGFFYKDKTVAIVGSGKTAVSSAIYLSQIAKKVYIINRGETFYNEDQDVKTIKEMENIEIKYNSEIEKLLGTEKLEEILIKNNETNEEEKITLDGLFVLIGNLPNSEFAKDKIEVCRKNEIYTNQELETTQLGIYAIGDVRQKYVRQIVTAMSDAAIVIENLQKTKKQ